MTVMRIGSGVQFPERLRDVIVAKTAAYQLLDTDQRKTFTNEGALAMVNFTLPTAAAGKRFRVVVQDADGARLIAGVGTTIRIAGVGVSSSGGYAQSTTLGSIIDVVALNSTQWVAQIQGTWSVA